MPRPANALIVDDEPHVIVLLRALMNQLGVKTIWEASNGSAALEKVASQEPDVVILDINLPQVGGLEVLERIKAEHPKVPVIIVSAQSTMRTFERALSLGAVGYILKHAPKAEVLQMLSDALDKIGGAPAVKADGERPA
jgi:YesN/AraC family two-component response regulator